MLHIHELLTFITQHAVLTYGAIFLISLSESLAVVGLFIPGTVIMFGIGAVVATGSLELKPVLLLAIAGAVIGDGISYWLGGTTTGIICERSGLFPISPACS